jgi:hypothetical protein
MRRINVYGDWFLKTILKMGSKNTNFVCQSEDVKPNYRDDRPPQVTSALAEEQAFLYLAGNTPFSQRGTRAGAHPF